MPEEKFPILPTGNKVIAQEIEQKDVELDSGIILPGAVVSLNLSKAKILAVSTDTDHQYKIGDIVIYPAGEGTGYRVKGEQVIWLQHGQIWGIEQ